MAELEKLIGERIAIPADKLESAKWERFKSWNRREAA